MNITKSSYESIYIYIYDQFIYLNIYKSVYIYKSETGWLAFFVPLCACC
jgi:hypothetical protein